MADEYHMDLSQFSLTKFRQLLESGDVLPGRRVLKEDLGERFAVLESMGIGSLKDLLDALKSKQKIEDFSRRSGLLQEYLVILRREANSYLPKPINLSEFPGVDPATTDSLASVGVRNTQQLIALSKTSHGRAELSERAGVSGEALLELVRLSDLARINGVGPVFARLFYEAGVHTPEDLVACHPDMLFETLQAINQAKQYTKVMATAKDVAFCIAMAKELPRPIEY